MHENKNLRLRAIFEQIFSLSILDSRNIQFFNDTLAIFYFFVQMNYRCKFLVCNLINNVFITNKRTIKKHLIKTHNIEHVKNKIKSRNEKIDTICVQSLNDIIYYRFFVVRQFIEFRFVNDFFFYFEQHFVFACSSRVFINIKKKIS